MRNVFEWVAYRVSYTLAVLFGVAAGFLFIGANWGYGGASLGLSAICVWFTTLTHPRREFYRARQIQARAELRKRRRARRGDF